MWSIPSTYFCFLSLTPDFLMDALREKTTNEKLVQAVEQYFIRLHGDLFDSIYKNDPQFSISRLVYDPLNKSHIELVNLCKKSLNFKPIATNQDVFFSILKTYERHKAAKHYSI